MAKVTFYFNEEGRRFISSYYIVKLRILYKNVTPENSNAYEFEFLTSMFKRVASYGRRTIISVKQEEVLRNICSNYRRGFRK